MDDHGIGNQEVRNFGFHLTKSENEFFDENKNIIFPLTRIKLKQFKNKPNQWHFYREEEEILVLAEDKLSVKERNFIYTVDGTLWLLQLAKTEEKLSINKIKSNLKDLFVKIKTKKAKKK